MWHLRWFCWYVEFYYINDCIWCKGFMHQSPRNRWSWTLASGIHHRKYFVCQRLTVHIMTSDLVWKINNCTQTSHLSFNVETAPFIIFTFCTHELMAVSTPCMVFKYWMLGVFVLHRSLCMHYPWTLNLRGSQHFLTCRQVLLAWNLWEPSPAVDIIKACWTFFFPFIWLHSKY